MNFILIILFVFSANSAVLGDKCAFGNAQKKYPRVKKAYSKYEATLKTQINRLSLSLAEPFLIRTFKKESEMEIWLKSNKTNQYELFKTWPICQISGILGPKTQEGDDQTPEGFYEIDAFNPQSSYHLSMRINYPNLIDLDKAGENPAGGSIMIHGDCVTIGCLPMTNPIIEQLYVLAVENQDLSKKNVQVHIFPFRFDKKNAIDPTSPHLLFWENLKNGYSFFENTHQLLKVTIDKNTMQYVFE